MNEQMEARIGALPLRRRGAFAAGCAGRVLVIFEYMVPAYDDGPERAIDFVWEFASGGAADRQAAEDVGKAAETAAPPVDEQGSEYTSAMNAALAAAYSVDSLFDETSHCASLAAKSALDAVNSFDAYRGEGIAEEEAWEEAALARLESSGDQPLKREMFDDLSAKTPIWMRDWV